MHLFVDSVIIIFKIVDSVNIRIEIMLWEVLCVK